LRGEGWGEGRLPAQAAWVSLAELEAAAPDWADLCARAEPNPFAEPGFLLPLIAYARPRLRYVLIRDGAALIGFAALQVPLVGLARVWMSEYAALPALAFDRDAAAPALAALTALLAAQTRLAGLILPLRPPGQDYPLPHRIAARRRRTALILNGAAAFEAGLDPKRKSKWARKRKKLRNLTETPGADGIDAFFEVERKGWKGQRRSALADDPARLAFARAALQNFAQAGRLDALTLRSDGAAVAAGLVLIAQDRAFYWKTAYDEAHADASPGIQLTLAHSRRLADAPGLKLVDSCAVEDHPMIGRVWADALAFEDVALALRPEGGRPLAIWLALDRLKGRAREAAKRLVHRLRARQRG
jgi:CelD/BcsL family acetyltransferase involved in cellulose biosynthesis